MLDLKQLKELENAGCDIARFTVPDMDAVKNIAKYKETYIDYTVTFVDEDGTTVTLMLTENLGETVAWYKYENHSLYRQLLPSERFPSGC